jgi:hypothetical protein
MPESEDKVHFSVSNLARNEDVWGSGNIAQ